MISESIQIYWQKFLATLPNNSPYHTAEFIYEGWGDGTPEMADKLGMLIAEGKKTASCSSLWEWEAEGKIIPGEGLITVVLDGRGKPLCIIETYDTPIRKYSECDEELARAEGEGDLSLAFWREAHKRFFSRTLPKIGREFSEDMLLVCERFQVIYK